MSPSSRRPGAEAFTPPRCPRPECPAHTPGAAFPWRRKGTFTRACDRRVVQRFLCLVCQRGFSSQSFRLDYRLKRPDLNANVFLRLTDKSSLRRIARDLGVRRATVEHRLRLLGRHCKRFHQHQLRRLASSGGLPGPSYMDELETFEQDRKLKPVTVPLLIAGDSWFIVHVETAPLAPRGNRTPAQKARLERQEAREGKRRSGSLRAVRSTFEVLAGVVPAAGPTKVITDRKQTYVSTLRGLFGARLEHVRVSGRKKRDPFNELFPLNHTAARIRDLVSRLVRRSWCASKDRERLELHLWVMVGFRNYVDGWRSEPAWKRRTSAAARVGLFPGRLTPAELLRWADPLAA